MNYVYILKSLKYPKTYTGSTTDVERRLREHNTGTNCTYTKRYRPWELVYKEKCDSLENARVREKYLKSAAGRRFLKKNNLIPR